jgi:transposase
LKENVTFGLGSIALINKADESLDGYFEKVLDGIGGKAKDFIPCVKLLTANRMGQCYSINRLSDLPDEYFDWLGFSSPKSDRTLNRTLERLGQKYQFIVHNHQKIIKEYGLVTDEQFPDFSSSYFEGTKSKLGELGYSRDNEPGKLQITFGICTGMNCIPTALTIQKGNVQDKKHFRIMLKTAKHVLDENSVLIFDCGGNTKKNKRLVRSNNFHYITLKPKKVGPYKHLIRFFDHPDYEHVPIILNDRRYTCVKVKIYHEFNYIYFSEKLYNDQMKTKNKRFLKELKKNRSKLKKTLSGKVVDEYLCDEGYILTKGNLQKVLGEIPNKYVNGLEGYFVLQSSIDEDPEKILSLYKDRDKAEKLIRNMKEGTELHPIRHWNDWAVIGYLLIVFLTNFLINLTLLKSEGQALVKNVKLLKKYLMKLTVTIVYPPNGFRFHVISNISEEIRSILGNYIYKYRDKSLILRW